MAAKSSTKRKTTPTTRPKTAKSPAIGQTRNTARAGMSGGGSKTPKAISRPAGGTKTGGGKPAGGRRGC